jgi:hypothetical protein
LKPDIANIDAKCKRLGVPSIAERWAANRRVTLLP